VEVDIIVVGSARPPPNPDGDRPVGEFKPRSYHTGNPEWYVTGRYCVVVFHLIPHSADALSVLRFIWTNGRVH
jgi:hypothetical protein